MTTYNIDYSDPLNAGFSINPGEFNGPGGTGTAQTSLRLYGRGALEWGESVDENLVRIHENFAGATAPVYPVGGQLWMRQMLYVKVASTFYRWNFTNSTWGIITVTTIAGSISGHTNGTSPGQYVYSTADATLYRWDAPYKQAPSMWLPRALTVQSGAPTTQKPVQDLLFYDRYTAQWVTPRAATVGNGVPPAGNYDGQLYYDTSTGILYIWNAGENTWQQILGPANAVGAPVGGYPTVSNSNIDMQNQYNVVNIKTPLATDLTYAAPVGYVHSYVAGEIADATSYILGQIGGDYVPKVGGSTMNGTYTLTGTLNATTVLGSTITSSGTITGANVTATGTLSGSAGSITGTLTSGGVNTGNITAAGTVTATGVLTIGSNMNANGMYIQNVAYAIAGTDAANANFVNAVGAAATNNAISTMRTEASRVNPPSYKDGDIHIPGTGRLYIWMAGAFRQIWPAQYS